MAMGTEAGKLYQCIIQIFFSFSFIRLIKDLVSFGYTRRFLGYFLFKYTYEWSLSFFFF